MKRGIYPIITIIIILILAGCAQNRITGEAVSQTPLNAEDEQKVLADIAPDFEKKNSLENNMKENNLAVPETTLIIPDEYKDLPRKIVQEGVLVAFPNLRASDPDGDPIAYTFSSPLNERGEWQTKKGDQGWYLVTITASDGKSKVDQKILVIVEGANHAPSLAVFEDIKAGEGQEVKIVPNAYDQDGDKLTFTYQGWMNSDTYQTTADDAGTHIVTVTVSDGTHQISRDVKIIVDNKNRPPKLEPLQAVSIKEFDEVIVEATASDPDGDAVTITYGLPLSPTGVWKTKKGDAGNYDVKITASDGSLTDTITLPIIVISSNNPPLITGPGEIIITEGETASLESFVISDPDKDKVEVVYTGWMNSLTRSTAYEDAGRHRVLITASDGKDKTEKEVYITVKERNRAPVFTAGSFE